MVRAARLRARTMTGLVARLKRLLGGTALTVFATLSIYLLDIVFRTIDIMSPFSIMT